VRRRWSSSPDQVARRSAEAVSERRLEPGGPECSQSVGAAGSTMPHRRACLIQSHSAPRLGANDMVAWCRWSGPCSLAVVSVTLYQSGCRGRHSSSSDVVARGARRRVLAAVVLPLCVSCRRHAAFEPPPSVLPYGVDSTAS
jgi:hypothetical protein